MTTPKADDWLLENDRKDTPFLLHGCGIFALSNGDAVESVVHNLNLALTQTDYQYVDCFRPTGGARVLALKCKDTREYQDGITNVWMDDF